MQADDLRRYRRDPAGFIDRFITCNEKGLLWKLATHQRRVLAVALRWDEHGRLRVRTFLWGEMKKSGKTFLAACLVLWWAFTNADTEVIICANDLEQSIGRVFATVVKLLQHHPALAASATVRASDITLSNGTVILAISSDYKGAAGSRHSLVVFDELWGYALERAERLFEELTPPPTEENAWVLITTTAGWINESVVLERLFKSGLSGARLDDELELYQADELTMFWSHTPRMPWQTAQYYAEQRRHLREGTFRRLHRNEWVSAESTFLTAEWWDACIEQALTPALATKAVELCVGVDASTKGDSSAVVGVFKQDHRVVVAFHKIWRPTKEQPLDLEATVEAYLREICAVYRVRKILVDPYQMHRSIMTLKQAGLPIHEFPQTEANTMRMGQCLYDLVVGCNLRVYPSAELREQALNTTAIEKARGFRIDKSKASRKIDAIVALSMACVAVLDTPPVPGVYVFDSAPNPWVRVG